MSRLCGWLARHDGTVAILVYVAISLVWYRTVLAHMSSACACDLSHDPGDNADFAWWLAWFVHAIGNGLPLLHPHVIWTPTGINLAGTTASLLAAAIASPITLVWGPLAAYNLVMILAPAASGWAANRLCRHITGAAWPSLLAGATYGFSTYEIGQLAGHLQMVIVLCPPLAALCVIQLMDGTISSRRFVLQTSVVLVAQMLLSTEVMFTLVLVGAIALGSAWLTGTGAQRHELYVRLPVIALPCAITLLTTSWYVLQALQARPYAAGIGFGYPTDLLSFITPMPYTWLGGAQLAGLSARFPAGPIETNAYLGLPLLLIVGRYLISRRRARAARLLTIVIVTLTIWILGPVLVVAGKPVALLPYDLLARLPLLDEMMQGRVAVYLALAAAVTLALWLASPRKLRLTAWLCGVLALVSVLPNLLTPSPHNLGTWTNPTFFRTSMYNRYLKRGETVLPIMWGYMSESYMWQAEDHFWWNIAGGYWLFQPPAGWAGPITTELWMNTPQPADGRLLRGLIVRRHVDDIVVQDTYVARWESTLQAAGLQISARAGGMTLYHVPSTWLRRPS